jgi:hypothetical protein
MIYRTTCFENPSVHQMEGSKQQGLDLHEHPTARAWGWGDNLSMQGQEVLGSSSTTANAPTALQDTCLIGAITKE